MLLNPFCNFTLYRKSMHCALFSYQSPAQNNCCLIQLLITILQQPVINNHPMLVLLNIETLENDLVNLPANCAHKLTFKAKYTIYDVPDTFTGLVFEDESGELQLEHFNNPKGNRRKVITLQNKLAPGAYEKIKQCLFAKSRGEAISCPLEFEAIQQREGRMAGG